MPVSVPVVVRALARLDFLEAWEWHESQRAGLGVEFGSEIFKVLDRLRELPEIYGKVWKDVRAAGVRRFAYVVYYRVLSKHVEVIAILHGARNADEWKDRA